MAARSYDDEVMIEQLSIMCNDVREAVLKYLQRDPCLIADWLSVEFDGQPEKITELIEHLSGNHIGPSVGQHVQTFSGAGH